MKVTGKVRSSIGLPSDDQKPTKEEWRGWRDNWFKIWRKFRKGKTRKQFLVQFEKHYGEVVTPARFKKWIDGEIPNAYPEILEAIGRQFHELDPSRSNQQYLDLITGSSSEKEPVAYQSGEFQNSNIWNYPLLGEKLFGSRIKNSGLRAIGEMVLLVDAGRREFRSIKIRSAIEPRESLPHEPSGADLEKYISSCADFYNEAIVEYLASRANLRDSAAGINFENEKIGVQTLTLPTQPGQAFEISVVRTSFWIEREFNRRIVLHDVDARLIGLADNAWERLLKPHVSQMVLDFPCTLYLELAVVTADDQFLLLRKARNVPNIPVWCCSVERGFRWGRRVKPGEFDIKPLLVECLEAELQLTSSNITRWSLFGLGIKAHLDSAILGYVKVNLKAEQLSAVIEAGIKTGRLDYFSESQFVSLEGAVDVLKGELWYQLHPTSLARVELTLRSFIP